MHPIPPHSHPCVSSWISRIGLDFESIPLVLGLSVATTLVPVDRTPAQPPIAQFPQDIRIAQATIQQLVFVDPKVGNDATADGSQRTPFRTLTQALQVATPNSVIMLSTGIYSADSGEQFPIVMKPGVSIQGNPGAKGQDIVIRGGGPFLSPTSAGQNITILGANQAGLTGVTVTNPNPRGYGLWVESSSPSITNNTFTGSSHDGISTVGTSAPLISGNRFAENGANGITIFGRSQPNVQGNIFEHTGYGINISENAAPRIFNNQILENRSGILVQENARPLIRGNTIENSTEDGIVAIAQSQPNLGTAEDPGHNVFRGNGRYDLNAKAAKQTIPAFGNQLSGTTVGQIDTSGTVALTVAPPTTPLTLNQVSRTSPPSSPAPPIAPSPARSALGSTFTVSPAAPSVSATLPAPSSTFITQLPPTSGSPPVRAVAASSPALNSVPAAQPAVQSASTGLTAPSVPSFATVRVAQAPKSTLSTSSTRPIRASNAIAVTTISVAPPANAARSAPSTALVSTRSISPPQAIYSPAATRVTRQTTVGPPTAANRSINRPIDIPVPPPETSYSSPQPSPVAAIPSPQFRAPQPRGNVLPVPSGDIPIGNIGDMPKVEVSQVAFQQNSFSTGGLASRNLASTEALRYRVVVEADSENAQSLVRSLEPSAFFVNGQEMMQIGAFSSRNNAEEAMEMLNRNGLRGIIQRIE